LPLKLNYVFFQYIEQKDGRGKMDMKRENQNQTLYYDNFLERRNKKQRERKKVENLRIEVGTH
jgi:hypothetical protein